MSSLTSSFSQSVWSWFYVLQSNKKELQALKDREAQFLLELNKAQQEIHKLRLNLIAGVGHYEATVWLPPSGSRSLQGHCLTSSMWGGQSLWGLPYWGLVNMRPLLDPPWTLYRRGWITQLGPLCFVVKSSDIPWLHFSAWRWGKRKAGSSWPADSRILYGGNIPNKAEISWRTTAAETWHKRILPATPCHVVSALHFLKRSSNHVPPGVLG